MSYTFFKSIPLCIQLNSTYEKSGDLMNLFQSIPPPPELHRTALLLPFNDNSIGKDDKVVLAISTGDKNKIVDPQHRGMSFI